jgi:hypothetical protein
MSFAHEAAVSDENYPNAQLMETTLFSYVLPNA